MIADSSIPPVPATASELTPSPQGGVSSIDPIDLVYRYRKWLIMALIIGTVLGYLAYKKVGPVFLASSQILVERKVNIPIRTDARTTFGERSVHVTIIKSPRIVKRAYEAGGLAKLPSFRKAKEPIQDIIDSLKIVRVTGEDHNSQNVFGISYRNRNKEDAEKVVDAIVAAYKTYLDDKSKSDSSKLFQQITESNERFSEKLKEKRLEFQKFRASSPVLFRVAPGLAGGTATNVINVYQDQVDSISAAQRKLNIKRMTINSKIATLKEAISEGDSPEALQMLVRQFMQMEQQGGGAAQSAVIAGPGGGRIALEAQLIPLMLEEQKLMRTYDDSHPEVQNVRKRIQTVLDYYRRQGITPPKFAARRLQNGNKTEPDDIATLYIQSLRRQLVELGHRATELSSAYATTAVKAKEYARYQETDQTLSEELEQIKSFHNGIVKQMNGLDLDKENTGYRLDQIAPVRAEIDFKRILKFIGGGGIMGVICVLGLGYLKELQDTTVKSMIDVRDAVEGSLLGSVPMFVDPSINLEAARHTGLDPMLYYVHQPGSAEAESYRSVRTALFVRAASEDAHVLQVTSAEPGDGKTTSTCNLASAVAQSGKRVLIIDADLRRSSVHKIFGLKDNIGLSSVLSGEAQFEQALQPTPISGLTVMAAGPLPEKPAELLASTRLVELIKWARDNYDIVFIDSPPVLAVSDPCIIAPLTDGLLLVVRMNKNRRASLIRVKETLAAHGVKTLGVIANGLNSQSSSDYVYTGEYAGRYGSSTSGYLKPTTGADARSTTVVPESVKSKLNS